MLTRLRVNGFKNLVDVDICFSPFTCIAGPNGVGKSNLFDAIRFLNLLADKPIREAALQVRDTGTKSGDLRSLFHHVGDSYATEMTFAVEMIIPREATDDSGQKARAKSTFLRYSLVLGYVDYDEETEVHGAIKVRSEALDYIKIEDGAKHLLFPHSPRWRKSVLRGQRQTPFISTSQGKEIISAHQDGKGGRLSPRQAKTLPRTVLSQLQASEYPTTAIARKEMRSWRLLQLEPRALRQTDGFTAQPEMGTDGSHLAATLSRLSGLRKHLPKPSAELLRGKHPTYSRLAAQLARLIDDVKSVWVHPDESRETLTVMVTDSRGTSHPAQSLSDGTLRFLALAILDMDPAQTGVICLEEPENGIHPERIPAMLELLNGLVSDVQQPLSESNPLRQVIINTHSPAVVCQVDPDVLLVATAREFSGREGLGQGVTFRPLTDTWRSSVANVKAISKASLLAYLNPYMPKEMSIDAGKRFPNRKLAALSEIPKRVMDREDILPLIFNRQEPR